MDDVVYAKPLAVGSNGYYWSATWHRSKKCCGAFAVETTVARARLAGYGPCGRCARS